MQRAKLLTAHRFVFPFLLLFALVQSINAQRQEEQKTSPVAVEIPTVAFCEMVRNPQLYFDKTIRLTATYEMGYEAQYLSDEKCPPAHDDRIGLSYAKMEEEQRERHNSELRKISSAEYGGRAKVVLVGLLRNQSRRSFAWYKYRFDIIRPEKVFHVIVPYEGELQAGKTYRAGVRGDSRAALSLVQPLRTPAHYAVLIEWTNLGEFPALERLRAGAGEKEIVFSVISDQREQITERRWNRTLRLKVISSEN